MCSWPHSHRHDRLTWKLADLPLTFIYDLISDFKTFESFFASFFHGFHRQCGQPAKPGRCPATHDGLFSRFRRQTSRKAAKSPIWDAEHRPTGPGRRPTRTLPLRQRRTNSTPPPSSRNAKAFRSGTESLPVRDVVPSHVSGATCRVPQRGHAIGTRCSRQRDSRPIPPTQDRRHGQHRRAALRVLGRMDSWTSGRPFSSGRVSFNRSSHRRRRRRKLRRRKGSWRGCRSSRLLPCRPG